MSDATDGRDLGRDLGLLLDEYSPLAAVALTDDERWPQLDPGARDRLHGVLAHPSAPSWTHRTGHRLDAASVERARRPLPTADWLPDHLATVAALPAYRRVAGPLVTLADFPLVTRDDLLDDIGGFVPLDADLGRMVEGTSSGSTGRALIIPDDVEEVARTFWLLRDLVERMAIEWQPDPRRLALAYVVDQRQAFTYASSVPGFGGTTMARLNLNADSWPTEQRDAFLADTDPQVYSGSPASLARLLEPALVQTVHPVALLSGAVHLSAPLRAELQAAFGCPVIDLYGLHETRPIAVSSDGGPFVVLDRRVVVEVLDDAGAAVPEGQRGEIVVTAGENPLLPLARYRTGDYGRLTTVGGRPAIADLEGREDVTFFSASGAVVPAVDLTQQLQANGAYGWTVLQRADGSIAATVVGGDTSIIHARMRALLRQETSVESVGSLAELGEGKPRRYRRESRATPKPT